MIKGKVVHGAGRGAGLGFPTVNLDILEVEGVSGARLNLEFGVYACEVLILSADESDYGLDLIETGASGLSGPDVKGNSPLRGRPFMAAMNWGSRPTFNEENPVMELFLLDLPLNAKTGELPDLYGMDLGVQIVERIRGVQKFASVDELMEQIKKDVEKVRGICARA
jgi:riboflavin kinase/FMN adenylyltransferase